ncbi:glycoside hydrolase family 16 protein [Aplosporella prunicola CBS 121167]|uniref:Glycoside hydrolase family 16 protein n=1 Tax=Aplosporella prunicola CBS 121167 TaxID=1176127 RepID=A0A6A6B9T6_9PEZI|nr:glycoside hydrolase family 16 protein [Aplosporella prunicola CBS 121167]KAF2139677.1 glycoside hydrolase family 16 protein [Aplosporella prunicola CBS 121167]
MFSKFAAAAAALLAATPLVSAQTYTDCDPTKKVCPVDVGLPNSTYEVDFTKGENTSWVAADYTFIEYGDDGATFSIESKTDAPTIHTDFYFLFGYVEVKMRPANGTGIISSVVLESDDLDEIDWEWLGGNNTSVETNYFGKGNTTTYDRATYVAVDTPVDTWHTYGINWTKEAVVWSIDGEDIRTLKYEDAVDGKNFPQTPCRLNLGSWAGGASDNKWTVEWAGGKTNFEEGPFKMYVQSVKIQNFNPAMNYNYTDLTGSYQSIDILNHTTTKNSSSATATKSSGINTDGVMSGSGASSASGAASSDGSFKQSNSSAAGLGMDKAWIVSSSAILMSFVIGFSLL